MVDAVETTKKLKLDKSSWRLTELGDLATDISKRVDNPATSNYQRFVGLEHFVSGDLKIKNWGSTENLTSSAKAFEKGDILFARRNAYLRRASLVEFDGCCSGDAFVLRENHDKIIPGFLAFVMNSNALWDYAISNAAGTMSKRVKWRDLAKYQFLLPPKDQQAQLAELLWAMDEVVERAKKLLEANNVLLYSFREEKLCSKSHPRKKLGNGLQEITAGKSLNGTNTPATNGHKGVLKVSAVGANGFEAEENKVLSKQDEFLEKFKVNKLDVLITRANTTELVGRTCLVEKNYPNLMLSDKTLRLEVKDELLNRLFLVEILRSKELRQLIEGFATGTGGAMKNISQNEIKSLTIPFPAKDIQDKYANQLNLILENKSATKNKIEASQSLQKSLINQIF